MSEVKTNKISSLASNNDITIDPDGTGDTIVASGNVGIGTTTPAGTNGIALTVNATTNPRFRLTSDNTGTGSGDGSGIFLNNSDMYISNEESAPMIFRTSATERMRIDSSGNLLVSKTSSNVASVGFEAKSDGAHFMTRDGGEPLKLNRKTSDGNLVAFSKDGSTVGSIGTYFSYIFVGSGDTNLRFHYGADAILPASSSGASRDNAIDFGTSSARFDDIFATNGTIQTSDQNEKQQIASLTTAEITAAKAISALFKTFKWNDKVEAKGDDARTHTGVIAQEVQTAMTDAGLDAADYAFWCSDTWTDDDGNSQTRMGIRYPELLAFVGAATEQRLTDIETRITALETE